jgi:uncharacterized protein YegL
VSRDTSAGSETGRLHCAVYIHGFEARSHHHRAVSVRRLAGLLATAVSAAGLAPPDWSLDKESGGVTGVFAEEANLASVVRRLVTELDLQLTDHLHEGHGPESELRALVLMYMGSADVWSRLRTTRDIWQIFHTGETTLVQVISADVHRRAVLAELGGLRPWQFEAVRFPGWEEEVYVHIPPPHAQRSMPIPALRDLPELPAEFAEVPSQTAQRLPLLLCLDTSETMAGQPIQQLNDALRNWAVALAEDPQVSDAVDLAIVTFGGRGVSVWQGPYLLPPTADANAFVPAYRFEPPQLGAFGHAPMTDAVETSLHILESYKKRLRNSGLIYYRPQILMVTHSVPTDREGEVTRDWMRLAPVLARGTEERKYRFYAIGAGELTDEAMDMLRSLSPVYNAKLDGFPIREVLSMISVSVQSENKGAGDEVFEKIFSQFKTQRRAWSDDEADET